MNTKKRLWFVFGLFMLLIYGGMSYLLLFSPLFTETVSGGWRYGLGIVLGIYGVFRACRMWKRGIY